MKSHPACKYLWIPLYIFAEFVIFMTVNAGKGPAYAILLLVMTAMVTIPSPLVEPRYFAVSCAMFLQHLPDQTRLWPAFLMVDAMLLALMTGKLDGLNRIW